MGVRGLRNGAIFTFFISMAILLVGGYFAVDKVPPIPAKIVSGQAAVTDQASLMRSQDTYQRYGLIDHGSV
jgi:nitric oxide reductase subunit B